MRRVVPCVCGVLDTPNTGLAEGMFDFVEIKTVKAVQVRPIDRESHWNCDGELLPENHISIRAHRGLVQVCRMCGVGCVVNNVLTHFACGVAFFRYFAP